MTDKLKKLNCNTIIPVILAGGVGKRLWPLSRKNFPKQFSKISSKYTLFQETIKRLAYISKINFNNLIIVTNNDYRFIVKDQLRTLGINKYSILIEPSSKNTAPAILAATLFALNKFTSNIHLLILPSDHFVKDIASFAQEINNGTLETEEKHVLTFGIKPNYPETGYGYIKTSKLLNKNDIFTVEKFIEKPDKKTAEKFVQMDEHLWNSGIFLFKPNTILRNYKTFVPEIYNSVKSSLEHGKEDLSFFRLSSKYWKPIKAVSFDYSIMEKISNVKVVKSKFDWCDLGSWNSVWENGIKDKSGNVKIGNVLSIDCNNILLKSTESDKQLMAIGLKDIAIIDTDDALLVIDKDRSQEVQIGLDKLIKNKVKQAEVHTVDYRPWGWFKNYTSGKNFKVKKIHVYTGQSLSLQSHDKRSEHWVVVKGVAKVVIDESIHTLTVGKSIFIPQGSKHRLSNEENETLEIIEVQIGSYLEEDDIIRYEDIYNRNSDI